jgi:hypothetical protein
MVPPVSRRRALQASCAAGLAAVAGCLGGDSSEDSDDGTGDDSGDENGTDNGNTPGGGVDLRPYPEYVTTDDAGEATAIYADFAALESAGGGFEDLVSDSQDPLLLIPAQGTNLLLESSLTLESLGLAGLLNSGESDTASEIDALLLAGRAFVAMGTVEPDEVVEALTSDSGEFGVFESTGENGAYTLYQQTDGGSTTVAVSQADIVAANSRGPVERAVEAAVGDRTRARNAVDEFGWVLDAVDDPDVAFAGHGSSPAGSGTEGPLAALSDASSFITTHTFTDTELTAEAAAVFPSQEALDDATESLETSLGSEASDPAFEFGEDRLSVTASYQASASDDES